VKAAVASRMAVAVRSSAVIQYLTSYQFDGESSL
jgi:hypothetical protein